MIYYELEVTAQDAMESRIKMGGCLFYGAIIYFFFNVFFHPRFEVNLLVLLIFGSLALFGYWNMSRKEEFDDFDGKWHFYVNDEKVYLLKPDDSQRVIFLSDIREVEHIIKDNDENPDDHYCCVWTIDNQAVYINVDTIKFSPKELVQAFKELKFTVNEINGRYLNSKIRDINNKKNFDRLGTELVDFYHSDKYLVK